MQYVSRKTVEGAIDKIFFNNAKDAEISVDVLIRSLIEEFSPQQLTQEQKNKLGQLIFFNPDVIQQLEQSETEAEDEYIANYDTRMKLLTCLENQQKS